MPLVARISGPFDQVLKKSSIEWAINSKTNEFQPMNVIFNKHDPMEPRKGYHVTIQLHDKPIPSSSTKPPLSRDSTQTQESTSEFAKDSDSSKTTESSSTAPSLELSETTFARSELSEIASLWSGDSFETSLTLPSDTNSNEKNSDESVSDKGAPYKDVTKENPEKPATSSGENTKTLDKGKGKVRDDAPATPPSADDGPVDPRTFQPHYQSLLDDFDNSPAK
ncbi:hypothetical protein SLS62_005485 [Diatrype stigma]|uniref:Uncharacterized protein n=1 Tax=Diatrype stigma TaxID=117547 RepID=A0AAN9USY2_9PEZI